MAATADDVRRVIGEYAQAHPGDPAVGALRSAASKLGGGAKTSGDNARKAPPDFGGASNKAAGLFGGKSSARGGNSLPAKG